MKGSDYATRLRSEVLHCPQRAECPLGFLCGERVADDRYLLPSFQNVDVGELVWTDLSARQRVYVMREGLIVAKVYANGDEEMPTALFSRGVALGMPDMYVPYVASDFYFLSALTPTRLCVFDVDLVKERVNALPGSEAQQRVGRITMNQSTATYGQLLTLAHSHGREKVASVLLRMDHELSRQPGFTGELPVTHDDVAFLAGCERSTTSRQLKALARDGLIDLGYRRITVLPALRETYGDMIEANLPFYDNSWAPYTP